MPAYTSRKVSGRTNQLLPITVPRMIPDNEVANFLLDGHVTKDNVDTVSLDESISGGSSVGIGSTIKTKSLAKTRSKIFVVDNDGSYSSAT